MELDSEYLRGHFTSKNEKGLKRTVQSYYNSITEQVKKKSVSWLRHNIKSERQALKYLRSEIEKDLFENPSIDSIKIRTFGELIDVWLKKWKPTVRETTARSRVSVLNMYILPHIPRSVSLRRFKPIYLEAMWADILGMKGKHSHAPLEKATLESIRSLLRQILFYGYRNDFVPDNPQKAEMKIPRDRGMNAAKRRRRKFLDHNEVALLLEAIEAKYRSGHNIGPMGFLYRDLVEFMIRNGLRISEASALTAEKIDFNNGILTIDEALVAAGRTVADYQVNAPKTEASAREIELDDRSIEILINRMRINNARQKEMRQREKGLSIRTYKRPNGQSYTKPVPLSKKYRFSDYIFQTQNGTPVVYHSFNEFMNGLANNNPDTILVKDIMRELDPRFNKHMTTHTFRYTHISLLAEANVPIKAIMERVGHSDVSTTLQIYNQVTKSSKEQVLQEVSSWNFVRQNNKIIVHACQK
ncbi:tyrosine-type recombinase/integrase [Enterococcus dongliensis]|uniref:tyrosine-type recombinase/integrase n=1 Tax=Enterococcus dongliensis TaxID=2559925 RepID=UPI00288DCEEC|nr:tyrosine-type recombinase/integrase [Enterococcus dongliensis]MDT2613286.1 tyrosine-type recombinase/integrase [Enterococcus dongliensis]